MDNNSIIYKIISGVGQVVIQVIEAVLGFFSKEKGAIIPADQMAWTNTIEQNTPVILRELNILLSHYDTIPYLGDLSEEQKRIIAGEKNWKTYVLYMYGAPIDKNITACPETSRIIKGIPGMTTAFFSILEPHTHLIAHRGPYKGVLRYHLGLIIPAPRESCGIRIDGQIYHWEAGKSLIFDDTYIHEAWNDSPEKRVVLFVDFKRDFVFPVNVLNDAMIWLIRKSPFISNVLKKIEHAG